MLSTQAIISYIFHFSAKSDFIILYQNKESTASVETIFVYPHRIEMDDGSLINGLILIKIFEDLDILDPKTAPICLPTAPFRKQKGFFTGLVFRFLKLGQVMIYDKPIISSFNSILDKKSHTRIQN